MFFQTYSAHRSAAGLYGDDERIGGIKDAQRKIL